MGERLARLLVFGVGAACAPFLLVVLFTWMRDGHAVGLVSLLGRGDLFPGAAMFAGHVLVDGFGSPRKDASWHWCVGVSCLMFVACCGGYVVPYSGAREPSTRITVVSLVVFAIAVGAGISLARKETP